MCVCVCMCVCMYVYPEEEPELHDACIIVYHVYTYVVCVSEAEPALQDRL
jgi:hypothetical protein